MACLLTSMKRKKAEDRLRRSEAYLAEAQRLSHTGTAAYNETKILYWSDETYRIWGFDPPAGHSEPRSGVATDPPRRPRQGERKGRARSARKEKLLERVQNHTARWNGQIHRSNQPTSVLRKRRACRDCRSQHRRDGAQACRRLAKPQRSLFGGSAEAEHTGTVAFNASAILYWSEEMLPNLRI